jgi:hypothetical protein
MTDKLSLIESIVNENAVDFRQIVNKVLLEKLAVRMDEEYKDVAKNTFTKPESEETPDDEEHESSEEQMEEDEEGTEQNPTPSDRVRHSYGAY